MERIKAGIIGMGYIGASHVEAIRRIGFAEIEAVADANQDLALRKAEEFFIPKSYYTVEELLADPEIRVVHNCTPNNLHAGINQKILEAGKHLFSEKPLACTSDEAAGTVDAFRRQDGLVAGVNFNYRMNLLVQDMKRKVQSGEIGGVRLAHGSYLQGWLLYDTDYNWRIEPEISGPSRCVADIGSHWMDAVQTVTGAKITEVCADLATVIPVRRKAKAQVETFSMNSGGEYEQKRTDTEDWGAVLFRMNNGARGVFYVSQVSAGRGCYLNFEIDGSKASMYWNQETADSMWMGLRDGDNRTVMRNPNCSGGGAGQYSALAKGHPEGWNDAFRNNILSFYRYIRDGKRMGQDPCDFATLEDGLYLVKLTEAILESNAKKGWVHV